MKCLGLIFVFQVTDILNQIDNCTKIEIFYFIINSIDPSSKSCRQDKTQSSPCPPPPQAGSRHSRPRPHRPTRRCSAYSPAKLKIQRNITVKYTKAHKHMHTTCSLPRQKFLPLLISYLFSLFHLGALTHTLSQPCYHLAPNLALFSTYVF